MKKVFVIAIVSAIVSMAMISCSAQAPKAGNLKSDVDSLAYAIGLSSAQGLDGYLMQKGVDSTYMKDFVQGLTEGAKLDPKDKKAVARQVGFEVAAQLNQMYSGINKEIYGNDSTKSVNKDLFIAGFIASATNKDVKMNKEMAFAFVQEKMNQVKEAANEKQYGKHKEENIKFLADNKGKEGVVTTASGLQYQVIKQGTGAKPVATDKVKVHYTGSTIDGNVFESSVQSGTPAEFGVTDVIKGWTEALLLMPVGSKYKLFIPYEIAYGAQGSQSIQPYTTLIFEIELLEIVK